MNILTAVRIWESNILPDDFDALLEMNTAVILATKLAMKAGKKPPNISVAELLGQQLAIYHEMVLAINQKLKSLIEAES